MLFVLELINNKLTRHIHSSEFNRRHASRNVLLCSLIIARARTEVVVVPSPAVLVDCSAACLTIVLQHFGLGRQVR